MISLGHQQSSTLLCILTILLNSRYRRHISDYFSISNGVRQGGILSPKLFSVYVDDLSDKLVESKVGCSIDNLCMNHVMYADDIYIIEFIEINKQ